jgi:hypothetical protein
MTSCVLTDDVDCISFRLLLLDSFKLTVVLDNTKLASVVRDSSIRLESVEDSQLRDPGGKL